MTHNKQILKKIPAVGKLLQTKPFRQLIGEQGHDQVVHGLRQCLEDLKQNLLTGQNRLPSSGDLAQEVRKHLLPLLKPVINATGVMIHTHLGRSPLPFPPPKELEGYTSLEINLKDGGRGKRNDLVLDMISRLCGSESGLVVNNNAAALYLLLNAWCDGKEVLVSRGELVEIGGSFRIPDIMEISGAILREVGTTNRTHLSDYRDHLTDRTVAILRTHPSNYRIKGFTASPDDKELADLAREKGLLFFIDQGCGAVSDLHEFGLHDDPPVSSLVESGAHAVCFSGDKLLGGPQAGIIAGTGEVIDRMHRHPLYRVLRPGKETLVYLSMILDLHLKDRREVIPLYRMASLSLPSLRRRARNILRRLDNPSLSLSMEKTFSRFGGGTTPIETILSLSIRATSSSDEDLYRYLLKYHPPILARREDGHVFLDLRTVFPGQDTFIQSAFNDYRPS